jgi:hypothetical protein
MIFPLSTVAEGKEWDFGIELGIARCVISSSCGSCFVRPNSNPSSLLLLAATVDIWNDQSVRASPSHRTDAVKLLFEL